MHQGITGILGKIRSSLQEKIMSAEAIYKFKDGIIFPFQHRVPYIIAEIVDRSVSSLFIRKLHLYAVLVIFFSKYRFGIIGFSAICIQVEIFNSGYLVSKPCHIKQNIVNSSVKMFLGKINPH